jgi:hypothetical protein
MLDLGKFSGANNKIVFNCVFCGSKDLTKKIGAFAPYVSHKIFDYPIGQVSMGGVAVFPSIFTNSIRCQCCGFIFSQLRPDNDEVARLYGDYRRPSYAQVRDLFEPGYAAIHDQIGNSQQEMESRQAAMADFLQDVPFGSLKSVLDYGGDRGQHIPPAFSHCDKHVFDISKIAVVNGVNIVNSLQMLDKVDFIMSLNVFEHLSYPMDVMTELRSVCHKDTYVFIDIPLEVDECTPPVVNGCRGISTHTSTILPRMPSPPC